MAQSEIRFALENHSESARFPFVDSEVYQTSKGVSYLRTPGVSVISIPDVDISGIKYFLEEFPEEVAFLDYLNDPTPLPPSETLCKFAGQLCYESFGPKRTLNEFSQTYFENVFEHGHGSVLEHANITLFFWGISRSLTHELVRHRAGFGFSQVSQRYVGGKTLRFVERPSFVEDPHLHSLFEKRIDRAYEEYEEISDYLEKIQRSKGGILSAQTKTDLRKKVRQEARAVLPNETEAPIVVTANIRAWRHFLNMRCSEHAEVEIRRLAFESYRCLFKVAPVLFGDFTPSHLADGTHVLSTIYPKV